jgi:hypothetical protein
MRFQEAEPVLAAVYKLLNEKKRVTPDAIRVELGRPANDEATLLALTWLDDHGYIRAHGAWQSSGPLRITGTDEGRQATAA